MTTNKTPEGMSPLERIRELINFQLEKMGRTDSAYTERRYGCDIMARKVREILNASDGWLCVPVAEILDVADGLKLSHPSTATQRRCNYNAQKLYRMIAASQEKGHE